MAAVSYKPVGTHNVTPYLTVAGADKAIAFYKAVFNAEERFSMPGPDGLVMHAEIQIGDAVVMISDARPEWQCPGPAPTGVVGFCCHVFVPDVDATFKKALANGGKELMPPMDMFWGDRFGKFQDPFGHQWSVATHQRDLTPEQIMEDQKKFFANCKPQ